MGLAQSLIRQPSLLLLDEPLSALDLNYQFHVMDLVRRETRKRNIVTVVVVHDINIALRHGDHVLMLQDGDLIADGAPEQVITPQSGAGLRRARAHRTLLAGHAAGADRRPGEPADHLTQENPGIAVMLVS